MDPAEDRGHALDAAWQVWDHTVTDAWAGYHKAVGEAFSLAKEIVTAATDDYQRQVETIRAAT